MTAESSEIRSRTMRAVKSKNTAPEKAIRKLITSWGFRYRLNRKDLPGKPDLVFPKLKKVIFVHGCFWHGHSCKRGNRTPKNNRVYWQTKISKNKARDRQHCRALKRDGWDSFIVWECELKSDNALLKLKNFLES